MKGEVFFTRDIHTYIHAYGHRDSMTESAQWADSVKITSPKRDFLGSFWKETPPLVAKYIDYSLNIYAVLVHTLACCNDLKFQIPGSHQCIFPWAHCKTNWALTLILGSKPIIKLWAQPVWKSELHSLLTFRGISLWGRVGMSYRKIIAWRQNS